MSESDIIVVGAGSAGCVLASQLVARHGCRVTLIEAPNATDSPGSLGHDANESVRRPANWLRLLGSENDWDFSTENDASLAGRSLRWPRGRGLGGSGRINAMIWFPPTKRDFQTLAESVGTSVANAEAAFDTVDSLVQHEPPRWLSESARRFVAAVESSSEIDGQPMVYRRVNDRGRRWNPATLLGDAIETGLIQLHRAVVDRVLFSGDRVVGVKTLSGETISCRKHVVLCSGTIATPCILMRSGIGPREVLSECGIDVRVDVSTLGQGLQDHLIMPVILGIDPEHQFSSTPSDDEVDRWRATGDSPVASNIAEVGGLFDDDQVQIHVTPTHYLTYPDKAVAAMTLGVNVCQPQSRGNLRIGSADPESRPVILPNYLSDKRDLEKTIESVGMARRIAEQTRLAEYVTSELLPGVKRQSDESIAKAVSRFAQTLYHPTGTAANVETGFANLHIADASALSQITVGNPNATVMTLACLVADRIRL